MLRLVWKDVVVAYWFLPAAVMLYLVQALGMAGAPPTFLLMTVLFTGLLAFGPIGVEEIQGTETLWCSLPVSRTDVVLARHLAVLLGVSLGLAISGLAGRAGTAWLVAGPEPGAAPLGAAAYAALFCTFVVSAALFLPCYFRLGAGRGLALFLVLWLAVMVLLWGLASLTVGLAGGESAIAALRRAGPAELPARLAPWRALLVLAGPGFALALFAGSAALSARFYARRDC